jgi:hypothetical protein
MKLIVFALLCISCFCASAQHSFLEKEDTRLAKLFEKAFNTEHLDRQKIADKWEPMLEREMLKILHVKGAEKYQFPQLAKQVSIVYSPDNKFRLFVWDTRESGHTPGYSTIAQSLTNNVAIAKNINEHPSNTIWMDQTIAYDRIIEVDSNSYLFRGYCRSGSVRSSAVLAFYKLNGGLPQLVENAFDMPTDNEVNQTWLHMNYTYDYPVTTGKDLISYDSIYKNHKPIVCYDSVCTYIKYNVDTKILSYPETADENEDGSYSGMTGKMLHLHYNGQVFTRKEE